MLGLETLKCSSMIFQGYCEARKAQRQQDQVHSTLVTLIMANLKPLRTSESLNEATAYVLVFHLNCSFSRNWDEIFGSSRSLSVERSLGSTATCKQKANGEQEIKVRIILYTELCGTGRRMSFLEHQNIEPLWKKELQKILPSLEHTKPYKKQFAPQTHGTTAVMGALRACSDKPLVIARALFTTRAAGGRSFDIT